MMTASTQSRKIKCPHCGWERKIEIQMDGSTVVEVVAGTTVQTMRGVSQALIDTFAKIKEKLQDRALEEANAWILMPACPNPECKHTYGYNVKTGATRQ